MTEGMIKQNADAYADVFGRHTTGYYGVKDAFIAGAHSRDEEISQWELAYNNLLHNFNERGNELAKQSIELDQLRNPWISINAKLPEVKERVLFLCNNGKAYFGYNNIDNKSATITNAPDGVKVTHWMPIPELKGGEK